MKLTISSDAMRSSQRLVVFCTLMFFLAGQIGIASELPDLGDIAQTTLTPQMEKEIGDQIMNDIRLNEPTYVDDAEINDYLGDLGRRLVAASNNPSDDLHFFAINDKSINAFAMFGGYIGVHTGLLLATQSESELAGVMSHEISHYTQHHLARIIAKSKQDSLLAMAAIAASLIIAASSKSSSGSNIAEAGLASASAAVAESQLSFSRDFEKEADRIGFETLQNAGFDPRGMASFFQRLQRNTRLYENNAVVYISTHPLTSERITDMQNRDQNLPYRQIIDSTDYSLVRARIKAKEGAPKAIIEEFSRQLREKKTPNEAASRYGLIIAALRAHDNKLANDELILLQKSKTISPMIDKLAADVSIAQGQFDEAQKIYRTALERYPSRKSLILGYSQLLLDMKKPEEAEKFLKRIIDSDRSDYQLYRLLAQSYAYQGKKMLQHSTQAEAYALLGQLDPAIEQLQLAQKAEDGSFHDKSTVDARLREFKLRKIEQAKEKK